MSKSNKSILRLGRLYVCKLTLHRNSKGAARVTLVTFTSSRDHAKKFRTDGGSPNRNMTSAEWDASEALKFALSDDFADLRFIDL